MMRQFTTTDDFFMPISETGDTTWPGQLLGAACDRAGCPRVRAGSGGASRVSRAVARRGAAVDFTSLRGSRGRRGTGWSGGANFDHAGTAMQFHGARSARRGTPGARCRRRSCSGGRGGRRRRPGLCSPTSRARWGGSRRAIGWSGEDEELGALDVDLDEGGGGKSGEHFVEVVTGTWRVSRTPPAVSRPTPSSAWRCVRRAAMWKVATRVLPSPTATARISTAALRPGVMAAPRVR